MHTDALAGTGLVQVRATPVRSFFAMGDLPPEKCVSVHAQFGD
jgi:hypothetical protein